MNTEYRPIVRPQPGTAAGFTLMELMLSTTITLVVVGAALTAVTHAMRANQSALLVTSMNNTLRTGMDLMVRDMLQVGSGLPTGHVILTPSGANSVQINMPGPPIGPTGAATAYKNVVGDVDINAVNPGTGLGPTINGVATDMITALAADSTFNDVKLTARANDGSSITVDPAVIIGTGRDRVVAGQLIMLEKGSTAVLLQVTSINAGTRQIFFAANDSLKLNQANAAGGGNQALLAAAPAPDTAPVAPATFLTTTASRVRMVTYYLDTTVAAHPRLVRRINNGGAVTFDNTLGTTVAFDVENLQITYDLADGAGNPSNVRFVAADYTAAGACNPNPCSVNQVRKVNILLTGRSRDRFKQTYEFFRNTLTSQVSLRGMSFVNEYTGS
jgi:hypothetical protein